MVSETSAPAAEAIEQERVRLRHLRWLVDFTAASLYQADITPEEAVRLIVDCRNAALSLFPGREETFDLLYRPRFLRILHERFGE